MKILITVKAIARKICGLFTGFLARVKGSRLWLRLESWKYDPPAFSGTTLVMVGLSAAGLMFALDRYVRWDERRDIGTECSSKQQGRVPKAELKAPIIPLLSAEPAFVSPPPKPDPLPSVEALNAKPDVKAAPRPPKVRHGKRHKPRLIPTKNAIRGWST